MTIKSGYLKNISWNNDYKNFDYIKQPISDNEVARWRSEGYNHESFTGKLYDSRNPMPEWVNDAADEIGLYNCGFVFYRMKTNDIMPTHVDHFSKYCEIFNVERESVFRAVVFLEDWKSGHYFDISNKAIVNYKAGEWVMWSCDEPHFAANIGIEDRYTLQITGLLKDDF